MTETVTPVPGDKGFISWLPLAAFTGAALVLLLGSWPLSGVVAVAAFLVVLGLRRAEWLLALVVVSIPLQDVGAVDLGGVDATATRLTAGALVVSWLVLFIRREANVQLCAIAWGYAAVVAALLLSFVHVVEVGLWGGEVYRWTIAALVFLIAVEVLREESARRLIVVAIGVSVVGSSLMSFAQFLTDAGPPSYVVGGSLRVYATFGAPNAYAAFLELGLPVLLAITLAGSVWRAGHSWLWWWALVSAAVGMVSLFLTQSRGGALGIGSALGLLLLASHRRARVAAVVGTAAMVIALATPLGAGLRERFAQAPILASQEVQVTPVSWANEERRAHWRAGWAMMETYPISGVGAGQFDARYREFTPAWRFRVPRGHAHNGYIHVGAQAGVPGLAAMVAFVATLLASAFAAARMDGDSMSRSIRLGALAVVVAFSVHSAVDYLNGLSLGIQLAIVLALATAGARDAVDVGTSGST